MPLFTVAQSLSLSLSLSGLGCSASVSCLYIPLFLYKLCEIPDGCFVSKTSLASSSSVVTPLFTGMKVTPNKSVLRPSVERIIFGVLVIVDVMWDVNSIS